MALFLAITAGVEGQFPQAYVPIYFAKVVLVAIALWLCRSTWKDIRVDKKLIPAGVFAGLVGLALWIGVETAIIYPHLGERTAYDPYVQIPNAGLRMAFIAVRLLGLALLVPVIEELFWRSFVIRFASNPDWEKLSIGEFTVAGFLITAGLFAAAHPEWVVAFLYAAIMGVLLKQTKSIFACIVAHAVTNLGLGIYVLTQHQWKFW